MTYILQQVETRQCQGCGIDFQTYDDRKWFHKSGCGRGKTENQRNAWLLANRPNFPTEPCRTCGSPVVQYRLRRYDGEMRYCGMQCRDSAQLKAAWPPVKTRGAFCLVGSRCLDCNYRIRAGGKRCDMCMGKFRNHCRRLVVRVRWLLPRSCSICNSSFKSWGKDKRCPHCKTLRERVIAAGDKSVTILNVYTLGEGRCSICLEQTRHPRDWKIPGNRAPDLPSIDHITPISKGGLHDWTNVALACLRCNILKSNRVPTQGRAVNGLAMASATVPSDEFVYLVYGAEPA